MRYLVKTHSDIDRLANSIWGDSFYNREPAIDFVEKDSEYLLIANMPGVSQKEVNLEVHNNRLTLSTKREEETEQKDVTYLLKERTGSSYTRSFNLPKDADQDQIKADLKNGILTVSIKKSPEAGPKKINIK
ncbi:Hsp20/alpha crystallin family protein [Spirochaeta cellobiosiphila]|uniref:Hsp20/alpha crystallin family protein n=1 Tax=Spirochaeta cellobiosiphila TaxID=504483 RepID=UPI00040ED8DF|nr:Hsp20/alpha crystallin family protein [Spirochaeta cellobiosiphila]